MRMELPELYCLESSGRSQNRRSSSGCFSVLMQLNRHLQLDASVCVLKPLLAADYWIPFLFLSTPVKTSQKTDSLVAQPSVTLFRPAPLNLHLQFHSSSELLFFVSLLVLKENLATLKLYFRVVL